jgi:hypothetical protein
MKTLVSAVFFVLVSSLSAMAMPPNGPIVIVEDPPNTRGIAVMPQGLGNACDGTAYNLARFEVRGNRIGFYESDKQVPPVNKVKIVVRGGHVMIDALEITFRNGQRQTVIIDSPIPRGHHTAWIKFAGASARNIDELRLGISDIQGLTNNPNYRDTKVYIVGCAVRP